MSDEKEETIELMPELEAPPAEEMPEMHGAANLFGDDAVATLNGKFMISDSVLKLVTRDLRFSEFTRELLLIAMRVVKSEAGSLLELDYQNQCFFFRAVTGQSSDSITKFTVPVGQGIVGYVAESRQPLVVSNINENRMHLKAIEKAVGFETRNLIAIPILVRGQVFAVLELLNRVGEAEYTATDVDLLNYFCEVASKAIEIRLMIHWASRTASGTGGQSGEAA